MAVGAVGKGQQWENNPPERSPSPPVFFLMPTLISSHSADASPPLSGRVRLLPDVELQANPGYKVFVDEADSKQSVPDEFELNIQEVCRCLGKMASKIPTESAVRNPLRKAVIFIVGKMFADPSLGLRLRNDPRVPDICKQIVSLTADGNQCFNRTGLAALRWSPSATKASLVSFSKMLIRLTDFQPCDSWEDVMRFYVGELGTSSDESFRSKLLDTLQVHVCRMSSLSSLSIDSNKFSGKLREKVHEFNRLRGERRKKLLVQAFEKVLKSKDNAAIWASFQKIKKHWRFSASEIDRLQAKIFEVHPAFIASEELYQSAVKMLPHIVLDVKTYWYRRCDQVFRNGPAEEISLCFTRAKTLGIDPKWLVNQIPAHLAWNLVIIEYVASFDQMAKQHQFSSFRDRLASAFHQYLNAGDRTKLLEEAQKLVKTGVFSEVELGRLIYNKNPICLLLNDLELFLFCFNQTNWDHYVRDMSEKYSRVSMASYDPASQEPKQLVTKLRLHCQYPV